MKKFVLAVLVALISFNALAEVVLSPPVWDFGTTPEKGVIEQQLLVSNKENEPVHLRFVPTCDCIVSVPAELDVPAGGAGRVTLTLDLKDEEGRVDKMFFVYVDRKGKSPERLIYNISGVSDRYAPLPSKAGEEAAMSNQADVTVRIYHAPGCKICDHIADAVIPEVEKELGLTIDVIKRDMNDRDNVVPEYNSVLEQLGATERAFPSLLIGRVLLQGGEEIEREIRKAVSDYVKNPGEPLVLGAKVEFTDEEIREKFSLLPVILNGLIDGINPCAFAALVSLFTALALAGRRKREILVMGIFFTASVFLTYFGFSFGFFYGLKAVNSTFPIVGTIITWLLVGVLVVFAGLSFYDYYLIRKGRSNEMLLQLPDFFKKQIQNSIKTHVRAAAIGFSSFVLGVLVSVFELACTGQVLIPTISFITKMRNDLYGIFLIFIYCIMFILPLVGVFIATYRGLSSKKLVELLQKHMGKTKIALGIVFAALAVFMIVYKQ